MTRPTEIFRRNFIITFDGLLLLSVALSPGSGEHSCAECAVMRRDARGGAMPIVKCNSVGGLVLFGIFGDHHGDFQVFN